jgi:hypothetical protein
MSNALRLRPGDIIAVPDHVIAKTRFRESSWLLIARCKVSHRTPCKTCGRQIVPGDLFARCTEPYSDRCIQCVRDWPLAEVRR